jgi:hypothetical protein
MRFAYLLYFLAFAIAAAGQTPTAATATRDLAFSPVGLAFTETAQINVVNTATNPASGTAASCSGTISFNNSTGASVETPVKFTVTSGEIYSATLTAGKLGVVNGSRSEFIGSVQLTLTPKVPCTLTISLETFDATTGVTHLYLTNPAGGPTAVIFSGGNGPLTPFSEVPRL